MALPVNVVDLIHQRKVERTRIEYRGQAVPIFLEHWFPDDGQPSFYRTGPGCHEPRII